MPTLGKDQTLIVFIFFLLGFIYRISLNIHLMKHIKQFIVNSNRFPLIIHINIAKSMLQGMFIYLFILLL